MDLSALLGVLAQVLIIIRNEKNELKINHKLNSYATGDPVPIPGFVYFVVILISAIGIAAYRKYLKAEQKARD